MEGWEQGQRMLRSIPGQVARSSPRVCCRGSLVRRSCAHQDGSGHWPSRHHNEHEPPLGVAVQGELSGAGAGTRRAQWFNSGCLPACSYFVLSLLLSLVALQRVVSCAPLSSGAPEAGNEATIVTQHTYRMILSAFKEASQGTTPALRQDGERQSLWGA